MEREKNSILIKLSKPFIRVFAILLFISGVCVLGIPFLVVSIFFGISKANVFMSTCMRRPLNLLFADDTGNVLLDIHKDMLKEK